MNQCLDIRGIEQRKLFGHLGQQCVPVAVTIGIEGETQVVGPLRMQRYAACRLNVFVFRENMALGTVSLVQLSAVQRKHEIEIFA